MTEQTQSRPVILLLEDEPELSKVICTTLEREFDISTVANAEEAMVLLSRRRFDALVCDHRLPGPMQGLDFLITSIKLQPQARRILLTGCIDPESLPNVETEAQLSACLVKPLHIARLRKVLLESLGRAT